MTRAGHHSMMEKGASAPCARNILRMVNGIDVRSQAMMPDGDFTIAFWFKGYARGANNESYQFGWADGGWGGTRCVFRSSDYDVRYATGTSSTDYNVSGYNAYATDKTWRHYALRRDGNTVRMTINGSDIFTKTTSRSHQGDVLPLSIGALGADASGTTYRRGDKSIGFFCVFNRALSDAEISQLASVRELKASGSVFDGLVCGYELSAEAQLADITGNYPLTMYNRSGTTPGYTDELPAVVSASGGGYKRQCIRRSYRRSWRPSARFWQAPRRWGVAA